MLGDWLGETIYAQAAAMGNIQLLNGTTLEIAVQRGFQDDFLKHFQYVGVDDGCACGRALRSGSAVTIEDVERDDLFAPHRQIAASAGFRAVQSVPLVNAHGNALGMLSVHYAKPLHHPEWRLPELRVRARYAAQLVERMLRQPVG
ncbi:MAG TPA: GAF domain-containing protein [Burkholderiales bacterium]|nr:GAF domain-containing protein [Burkholderiales bacterium]